ncbi:MAG: hypothetical protein AAGK22_23135 [Acidobacteriota bacterium]
MTTKDLVHGPGVRGRIEPAFESLVPSTLVELPCHLVTALTQRAKLRGERVEESIERLLTHSLEEPETRPTPVVLRADLPTIDVEQLLRGAPLGSKQRG